MKVLNTPRLKKLTGQKDVKNIEAKVVKNGKKKLKAKKLTTIR